jgi:hypothetical protein
MISFLLILGLTLTPSAVLCKTEVASSIKAIQAIFEQSKGETLGLFDIDMVLIQTSIPAFQMANIKQHKAILKALLEPLTPLEKDMTLMLTLNQGHAILIEAQTSHIITDIRKKTPKLIALTSTLTGQWDDIKDAVLFRVEQLKSVGIDFSSSFPALQPTVFNEVKAYRNQHPEFKQGVLSANGDHKGATLIAFLKRTDYKPNAIIFVDDRENNITDIEKALSIFYPSIQFTGILYKGADHYPSALIDANAFKTAWTEKIQKAKNFFH